MKRGRTLKVLTVAMLSFLCLGGLGHSYAYLVNEMEANAKFETGDFENEFQEGKRFKAEVVNLIPQDGKNGSETDNTETSIKEVALDFNLLDEGKKAELIFKEGIPLELLTAQDNYLKLSYPLNEKGLKLMPYKLDLIKPAEKIQMPVKAAYLAAEGKVYEFNYTDTVFNRPLLFEGFRSIERIDNELVGNLYLRRVEPEGEPVELPQEMKLTSKDLEQFIPAEEVPFEQDGIQVLYSCEYSLYIDQAEADRTVGKR